MRDRARVDGGAVLAALVAGLVAGCSSPATASAGRVVAVGAEIQYANVISQIGGPYVQVTAIMSNPDIDPHAFEASLRVAQEVSAAQLVVQNGLGYDSWMGTIAKASPNPSRRLIDVQTLLGLPDSTPNPHLWYDPGTMPKVAAEIARDLGALDASHAAYFASAVTTFDSSLGTWNQAIARLKASYPGAPVATTEPVADDVLRAAGLHNLTPWAFQAAIMNGVDPSAQDVGVEQVLLSHRQARVFIYNEQVTDSLTQSLAALAQRHGIPLVGVDETMPTPGYDYQTWMVAEVNAIQEALASGRSTPHL